MHINLFHWEEVHIPLGNSRRDAANDLHFQTSGTGLCTPVRTHTHTRTRALRAVKGIVRVFLLDKEEKQRENVRQIC